ncbi:MAG: class I SAM-dependent methyltransferase [Alphaproteobacteria bacterium]|nr:class I SAM-dependent methyltransferase [Alphaproteobacteria bacterium]
MTDAEEAKLGRLRAELHAALAANSRIAPAHLVALAAYAPLHALPDSERLLGRVWPEEVEQVLTQQLREPLAERAGMASIPRLTAIEAKVSQAVRRQYEENPYPRWVSTIRPREAFALETYLLETFPGSALRPAGTGRDADVLIAGCGTGQHAIETAVTFRSRSVLAVDLSLASLAYAQRKSRELGAPPIEYAQADLMELRDLGRSFDLVEAGGVLHHLADPFAGWRVLLGLLRPGGVMRVALYSEIARRHVVTARAFIAERTYGSKASDIRALRQELIARRDQPWAASVVGSGDFATTSTCRDLLFHVQEHRLSLPQIAGFLEAEGLVFIGLEAGSATRAAYAARFPEDRAMRNLRAWHVFESENPDTFLGMYQFWVQKPA